MRVRTHLPTIIAYCFIPIAHKGRHLRVPILIDFRRWSLVGCATGFWSIAPLKGSSPVTLPDPTSYCLKTKANGKDKIRYTGLIAITYLPEEGDQGRRSISITAMIVLRRWGRQLLRTSYSVTLRGRGGIAIIGTIERPPPFWLVCEH